MLDHFSGKDQYVGILVSEGVYQGASVCSPTSFLRTEAFPQDLRAKPSDAGLGSSFAHSICRVICSLVHIFSKGFPLRVDAELAEDRERGDVHLLTNRIVFSL